MRLKKLTWVIAGILIAAETVPRAYHATRHVKRHVRVWRVARRMEKRFGF